MAIPILNHMDFGKAAELQNVLLHTTGSGDVTSPGTGQIIYDSGTIKFYNGSSWISLASGGSALTQEQVEDFAGTLVATGGTKTGITITYQDATGDMDFVIANSDFALTGDVTASVTQTAKGNVSLDTTIADGAVHHAMLNDDIISGQAALTSGLASTDEFAISDAGTVKKMDVSVLQGYLQSNLTFTTNTNTQLTQEQVEDHVGGMLDGTETFIDVSYDDTNGNIDFVVPVKDEDNMLSDSATHLATQQSIKAYVDSSVIAALTTEQVQDIVGAMFSSNTETRISATYQDADGTIDLVVNDMTANDNDDVSNANLLTALAALQSTSGAADENIVIGTDSGDTIVITGNLQVSGNTTTVNSTTVDLNDHNITLDSGNSTAAVVNGAGITLDGGSGDDATFTYNASTNTWEFKLGSAYEDIKAAAITGTTGNFVDLDISGDVDVDGTLEADAITINGTATGALALLDTIATAKIDDDAVTYAKVQNISATNKILGRVSSGAGVIEELSDSNIRTLINVADGSTANAKASEAEVQTGSNDAKFVTPLQLAQAKNVVQVIDVSSLHATQLNAVIQHDLGTKALQVTAQYKGAAADYQQVIIDWTTNSDTSGTDSDNHILVQFSHVPDYDITVQIHSKENAATATGITYPTS